MAKNSDDGLYERWEYAKRQGLTRSDFARLEKIPVSTLSGKIARAKKKYDASCREKTDDVVDGNYRTISSQSVRIRTVEELLEACHVDLTVWQVDEPIEIGSWEMGRRSERKDLTWKDGAITGGFSVDSGELYIEALFRIRVKLVRIHPIPIYPVVQPVSVTCAEITRKKPKTQKSGKVLIVPDSQMGFRRDIYSGVLDPFHSRRAHDIVLQVAAKFDFDAVTYLGDGVDFSEWTDKFVREPEFAHTTQPALVEFSWFLGQMKSSLPNAKHELLPGNHEARVPLQIINHLRAAYRLKPATELHLDEPLSLARLLGLREMGIALVGKYPNSETWHGSHARCIHGKDSVSASKVLKDAVTTTVFGHCHRIEQETKTVEDSGGRRYITAASPGCLCRLDYVVPGHKRGQSWQQGFGVLHYNSSSPRIELVPIIGGKAIYNDLVFDGRDYLKRLIEDTGYAF